MSTHYSHRHLLSIVESNPLLSIEPFDDGESETSRIEPSLMFRIQRVSKCQQRFEKVCVPDVTRDSVMMRTRWSCRSLVDPRFRLTSFCELSSIVKIVGESLCQVKGLAEVVVTGLEEIVEWVTGERDRFGFVEVEPEDVLETSTLLFETD